ALAASAARGVPRSGAARATRVDARGARTASLLGSAGAGAGLNRRIGAAWLCATGVGAVRREDARANVGEAAVVERVVHDEQLAGGSERKLDARARSAGVA